MKTKKILFGSTLLAAAALNFCATSATFAADVTWTGASGTTSGDETIYKWSDGGNWDSDSGWTSDDNAVFDDTATNKTVTVDGAYTMDALTISGGSYTFNYTESGSLTVGKDETGARFTIDGADGTSLTISGGTNNYRSLYVGKEGNGSLTITSGNNNFGDSENVIWSGVYIGDSAGSKGSLTIEGGENKFYEVHIGTEGTGTLTITGGVNYFNDVQDGNGDGSYHYAVYVGGNAGGTGAVAIEGGTNTFNVDVRVGYSGTGSLTISGEETSNTFKGSMSIGRNEGSIGTVTIYGGTNTFYEDIYVACGNPDLESLGGTGTMTIYGGTNTFKDIVWIGNNGTGTFELKGGTNTFSTDLRIGDYTKNGVSKMTISGGTNTFEADTIYIGYDGTVTRSGTLEITDGTTTFGSDTTNITISVGGSEAVGAFTISGGTTTINGSVTIAASSSATLTGGTISLSEAITNSGTVEISENVVFVLNDSLLTGSTYTLITNTDGGTITAAEGSNITGWSDLTIDNFVDANGNTLENVVLDFSSAGQVKLLTSQGGVVIDYEYETPWQRGTHGLSGIEESGLDLYYFRAIKFEVSGSTDNFVLQDQTNTTGNYAITGKNLYFVGSAEKDSEGNLVDSVTITSANIDNGTYTSYHATQDSFVVEGCTVIFDGKASANDGTSQLVIADLVMNLSIGTKADAELVITDGAQVKTGAAYNTVGANLAVGTITISGTDSVLDNQQITLGSAVSSEFGVSSSRAEDGAYWIQFIETDTEYDAVLDAITASDFDPTSGSYGIVNVESGGTWKVGVGNTDYSVNKLQLSNGEINVSGEGSELILGSRSSLLMMGESYNLAYGLKNSETVSVTGGGKISSDNTTETTNGTGVMQLIIGDNTYDSKDTVKISADGEGSSFDVYVGNKYSGGYVAVYIGTYGGYWDQKDDVEAGTVDVNISASDGGEVKISTEGAIAVAADNYVTYIAEYSSETSSNETSANSSHGLTVAITAEVGDGGTAAGTVVLSAAGDVLLAAGSAAEGYSNSVTVKADGSVTDEEDNEISSSVTISGANIYTNMHEADNVTVTITASNGGAISLIATSTGTDADGIVLNKNTTVIVEEGSSLTLSGVVTLAEGASMDLNGTIDLSNQIQNSGEITVGEDVVFVLRENDENFKDEDEHFNFTYDFITNIEADETTGTTGGSIEGWDSLSTGNFAVFDAEGEEVTEGIGVITKADGQATVVFVTESENGTATVDYDYYIDYQRNWTGRFYCIGITVDGTVDSFTLQDRTSITGEPTDITSKDVLFIGSGATDGEGNLVDSVTITSANISNTGSSTDAFAVEGTKVIIDGQASENDGTSQIVISELGMNIVVGTMYDAGDAELVITNGAQVTTNSVYNTVGSNLATGTITITGEGSTLSNQQITLGGGVNSMFPGSIAASGDYWTKSFVDGDTYNGIRDTIVSSDFVPTSGSYGIVNVTDGGTWQVGVGNTDPSNNRIQLANGEINIDGGSLIFGKNSSLLMMNESLFSNSNTGGVYTGMNISETVTVKNGGTVSVEKDAEGNAQTMTQLVIGDTYVASNVTAAVSVDGSDDSGNASSFIISASTAVYIGTNSGYWTNTGTSISVYEGGTADVTVSATDGGVISLSSTGGMVICADNYASYIGATADGKIYEDVGHSYGLKVAITAESGGSLTLATTDGSTVLLAAGSPADGEYTNTLTITAKGEGSSVAISGGDIYTNFGDAGEGSDNVYVTITATNGGTIALSAATVDDTGKGVISFGLNTKVTVEEGSSLTTEGTSISFESGSSISVEKGSTWTDTGSVIVATGATMSLAGTETISGTLDSQGAITVSDGTLSATSISVTQANGSESTTDGVLTIAGGETTVETLTIGNESLGGSFSMTGGTLNVTWTASDEVPTGGFSIASAASASFSGGTVNVSTAIANDGAVTVSGSIVFVLNDSLKVEGTSATYAIIINGGGGTIENWDTLGKSNFVYGDLSALDTNVVLDLTTDGYVKLLYTNDGVTIDYDYEVPWQRGTHGLSGIEKSGLDLYYFRAMHIEIEEGASVGGFTLQDLTNEEGEYAITSKNVYITGSGKNSSKLTITDINVSNTSAGYYAFVVENATVVIDGTDVNVSELGMSLCIGTMDSAELQITGGAQVSTSGVWSTIGSNMATGTLTISGEGSSLTNAQINIGMATTSLSGGANAENGDGYYFGRFVQTDEHYYGVIDALARENYQPTNGSYGIVNVKEGGTWTISGNDTSNSRLQFSNGEINIDGAGSSLIFGKNSSLVMGNMTSSLTDAEDNSVTLTVSETLNVKNGGTVKAADDVTLYQFYIGQIRGASKGEATISVDGEDSTFDVSADWVYIGMKQESTAGGTEDVKVSASNGGTIKISGSSSASAFAVGYTDGNTTYNYEQAEKMTTSFTAESGGKITLENASSSYSLYFGRNTATTEASGIDVLATGEGSEVNIISSNKAIWTNYSTSNFKTSFVAENGGTMTISASSDIAFGYGSSTAGSATVTADGGTVTMSGYDIVTNNNNASGLSVTFTATNGGTMSLTATSSDNSAEGIHLNSNSSIIVENGSILTTSSAKTVLFESGSSISVDATSTWTDYATNGVEVKAGATMDLAGTEIIYDTIDSQGTITVSGGTLDVGSIYITIGSDADSTFTISGGTVLVESLLSVGSETDVAGTFSIESGEIDASFFTIASTASANFSGGIVDVATSIDNSGSVTVTNEVVFVLSDALKDEADTSGNTYIVISTDPKSIDTWQNLSSNNFIFSDGSTLGRAVVNLDTDGVVTITSEEESATLIWNGTDSLHEWDKNTEDKDWKNGPLDDSFYMGDNVIFNEVAENKDVLIDETLIAGTITVEVSDEAETGTEIDYTFDFDNKASLEGESLSVGDGASLTVTGDGSLEIDGETDIAGDMTVTGGAKANFDDGVTVEESGSLTVTSDEETGASGSVNVSGDFDVNGSLSVEDGTLTADNLTLSKGDESEDGASAEFSGGETTIDGTVSVDENSSLTVSGDGSLTADSVEVAGTLDFEGGTLNTGDLTIASDDKTTLKGGDLNIGSLTVSEGDSVTFGDGLTVGVYGDEGLTLDGDLNVNLDGSVGFDTSNGDIEIGGTISDGTDEKGDKVTGSLTKTGSGTLTLDGENDYSGGTTIDEGTIEADNTDALGTGEVDIHKGATLKVHSQSDSDDPDSFENSTTGEGTLEIAEGDISLGDVGVQNVVVDSGAILDGDTTLTHSDASLDLAGTLEINVDEGEHITISDSGKVVLEYESELDLESPSLSAGDSFVIVDGGTVTGDIDHFLGTDDTLSSMQSDYAIIYDTSNGLSVSIENTGTRSIPNMRLHDGLYSDFIAAVITEEDMTLVAGIQGTGDVSSNPIARELLNGNVSRAVEMLNTLAPNDYAAMIAMPTTAFHNDVSSIDKRLAAVRAMPFSEDENARWGYFAQADGTFADNDDANDTPTFDFQLYGVLAGADYRMSNTLTVGVALGYDHEHAKLHNSGGRIDGDDVRVTVYAGAQLTDTVYANVGAQVGYGYYEARRHTVMGRASGETEGYNAGVFADVGMDLPLSDKLGISARPYVGLAYLRSFVSGFDDNLFDIGSFNNDSLRARVGLGLFWDLDGVSLGIDTSFSHDFCGEEIDDMSATYRATGSKFSMMAECLPEDVFSVGPVVSVGISEGLSAFAGYSFQAGSNEYIGHNLYIGVRASF